MMSGSVVLFDFSTRNIRPTSYFKLKDTLNIMEDKLGCVYLITCLENNKSYVGKTCKSTPTTRFKRHLCSMRTHDRNYPLYNDMRKYGIGKFKLETLCKIPVESLDNMEEYWAEQLETYIWDTPGGYNLVWCGKYSRLGIEHSKATKNKITDIQTGRKLSDYHKQQIKKSLNDKNVKHKLNLRNLGKVVTSAACENISNGLKGHSVSEETKQKISKSNKDNMTIERRMNMSYIKRNPNITLEIANHIRKIYETEKSATHRSLGQQFNVSESTIRRIVKGERYTY